MNKIPSQKEFDESIINDSYDTDTSRPTLAVIAFIISIIFISIIIYTIYHPFGYTFHFSDYNNSCIDSFASSIACKDFAYGKEWYHNNDYFNFKCININRTDFTTIIFHSDELERCKFDYKTSNETFCQLSYLN
jgi:hypothetical protein